MHIIDKACEAVVAHVGRQVRVFAQVNEGRVCDSIPGKVLGMRFTNFRAARAYGEQLNLLQVHEGSVRDGRLAAAAHVERVDPAQVHECRICDGRIIAP